MALDLDLSGIDFSPLDNGGSGNVAGGKHTATRFPRRAALSFLLVAAVGALIFCLAIPRDDLRDIAQEAQAQLHRSQQQVQPLLERALSQLPLPGQDSRASQTARVHVVQKGDSLSKIARRYGVSVSDLVAANQAQYPSLAADASLIQVGWRLAIPQPSQSGRAD